MSDTAQKPTSQMTDQDWQDCAESEFIDISESAMGTKTVLIFDHPKIGLHGIEIQKDTGTIRGVSVDRVSDQ